MSRQFEAVGSGRANPPAWIGAEEVRRLTPMPDLIQALRSAFAAPFEAPARHVHQLSEGSMLLLMPAWRPGGRAGVKVTSYHPDLAPSIQASYLLIEANSGAPVALLDGAMLTARRTAAASALAADYLAPNDASTLLALGTGTLIPHLVEAHAAVRPIRRTLIWGRDPVKAKAVAQAIAGAEIEIRPCSAIDQEIGAADIVTAATASTAPLIRGDMLSARTHLDLVGAFRPDMCEADPEAVARSRVFVDTRDGALHEAGDLLQAVSAGLFAMDRIEADLAELCTGIAAGRRSAEEITLFKSVGTALEDLAAAEFVFDRWQSEQASA